MKKYCTQNAGDCASCSLVSYGRDCRNLPLESVLENQPDIKQLARDILPKCSECADYFVVEYRGKDKRRCGHAALKGAPCLVPESGKDRAPLWCPRRAL